MVNREAFIDRIHLEIDAENQYAKTLEDGKARLSRTRYWVPVPMIILIIWSCYAISRGILPATVLTLWTVGSFFLYMFYFFLMAIPSIGSDTALHFTEKDVQKNIREFLRLANLLQTVKSNKVTLIEIFLNAFLINAKPLAKGFAIIYLMDLIFATLLLLKGMLGPDIFLMITVQILVIMAFYAKIALAKPNTPGFFSGVNLSEAANEGTYFAKLKALIYISVFGIFTGFLIIGAMLFPGLTLAEYLDELGYFPSEYPGILILSIISQLVILRYFQGVESRKLMGELNNHHLSFLESDLLVRVENFAGDDLDELRREFLLISMNKLMVQEFFKRFPAYVLVPNFLLIGDPIVQEVLGKTGDEKGIMEIL